MFLSFNLVFSFFVHLCWLILHCCVVVIALLLFFLFFLIHVLLVLPYFSNILNPVLFLLAISFLAYLHFFVVVMYVKTLQTPPGKPPHYQEFLNYFDGTLTDSPFTVCKKCQSLKPLRCHHCKVCGECVLRMDHHCTFLINA
ncbi:S-acyltransferase [Entamoeba marina]